MELSKIQQLLTQYNLDGWLIYDFRKTNDIACQFLQIPQTKIVSRRFLYWIPQKGEPIKIVHRIEENILDHLPGKKIVYLSWQELEKAIETVLKGTKTVAMEYSPRNRIPYISKVDAGTIDIVRELEVKVVSSADLLQHYLCVWDDHKLKTHLAAAQVLDETAALTWKFIGDSLKSKKQINEFDVQTFIKEQCIKKNCVMKDLPICAVNAHSADPHYCPQEKGSSPIHNGDFILIDLWCKQNVPDAVYADITRVGVAASKPSEKQSHIFSIVRNAQKAGVDLIKKRYAAKQPVKGWEVDQACRQVIEKAGYGQCFTHRTGHNIDMEDHGNGAHIDSLETQDQRELLPRTCFSIEPGIYLPGEFGIRLEFDVFIHQDGQIQITGGVQDHIHCLIS